MVLNRLIAFGLLLGCAGLILAAVVGSVAINLMSAYTDWLPLNSLLIRVAQLSLTIGLLTVAFAVFYKVLPYPLPAWRDVWIAALVAAILFTALQDLAELIFGMLNFSSFGVLGGAMMLLTWIYFCGQVILIGGEISYAWAHVLGSKRGDKVSG
jgi:membrane protein